MFVVIEGIDGTGKTTLARSLSKRGFKVTQEPYLDITREILSRTKDPLAKELVFYLDRLYHLEKVILPMQGSTIISDRYKYSQISYAYARYGDGELYQWVVSLNKNLPDPDMVFLLDIPPEEALVRKPEIADDARPYGEPREFFDRVREKYLALADENWVIIKANKSRDKILREVLDCLSKC